jgi:hypothetical protein
MFSCVLIAVIAGSPNVEKSYGPKDGPLSLALLSFVSWHSCSREVMMDLAYSSLNPLDLADSVIMRLKGAFPCLLA